MMTTSTGTIRIVRSCVLLASVGGMSHLAPNPAAAQEQVGRLTVTGTVKVDGKPAATGDIVAKGSEIRTSSGSSADINLGELGHVEVLSSTTLRLRYDEFSTTHNSASVAILLGEGSVKASNGEGIVFNVDSGMTVTRPSSRTQQNEFTVEASCGKTSVSVAKGKVELRVGDSIKQIAAGGQDAAGQAKSGCTPSR